MAVNHDIPPADIHGEPKKIHRRRAGGFSGPITFLVVIVSVIFVMSVLFRVSDISVEGNDHYTDSEIIQAIDIEEGDNLFFFDRFSMVSRVFAKLPYIEQVSVERSLPNKVIISVVESKALAYLELGDEHWTLDHNCKVLGKAAEGELSFLIPVEGIKPGTLLIGEPMQTADNNEEIVSYLAEVLTQIQDRGLQYSVTRIDFSNTKRVEFGYAGKYTVILGGQSNIEYKFGMFLSAAGKLLEGDVGIIDVSDGVKAHFSPN